MAETDRTRFVALDAWRGISALLVALYRVEVAGFTHHLPLVGNAWLFVDFFFVLSGFVIASAYQDRLGTGTATAKFVLRRFGRVWPLHFAILTVFVALEFVKLGWGFANGDTGSAFVGPRAPLTVLWDLFLVQSLGFTGDTWWNIPAWSISTEFWTYLVFAVLCFGGRRLVLAIAPIIVVVALVVVATYSPTGMDTAFDFGMPRCLAGFFAGVIAFDLHRRRILPAAFGRPVATALEILSIALVIAFVSLTGHSAWTLAAPAVFAVLVVIFARQEGGLSRLLTTAPGIFLGELSYSIYMTAFFVAHVFNRLPVAVPGRHDELLTQHFDALHPHLNIDFGHVWLNDLYAAVYLVTVLVVSYATHRWIEQPARAYFNGLANRVN